jgi:3-isopropylmalate dehydrogenase
MAAILTLAMMLADLGRPDAAAAVEGAVGAAIAEGIGTADVGGALGTRAVGEWIAEHVRSG